MIVFYIVGIWRANVCAREKRIYISYMEYNRVRVDGSSLGDDRGDEISTKGVQGFLMEH